MGIGIPTDFFDASADVNHDLTTNYVVAQHINWTTGASNFTTTGSLTVGSNTATARKAAFYSTGDTFVTIQGGATSKSSLFFGSTTTDYNGRVQYDNNINSLSLWVNNAVKATILNSGNMAVGSHSPAWANLEVRHITANNPTRLYTMPNGTVSSGLCSGVKMFATDFSADQTNYRDFGLWADTTGSFINVKVNGSEGLKDTFVTYNDTNVVMTWNMSDANKARLKVHGAISMLERSANPTAPAEGETIIWMSDGTGAMLGDDGDVMIASTAGGVTKYATLFDHSAGSAWPA